MEQLSLDEMRAIEMEITDEIDRICSEHDLAYFLAFGSLIGAIRHQGFVPWDDDMDLFMLRADYEVFVAHFDEWKSKDSYEIQAPQKHNAIHPFAKVVDTTTLVKQTFLREEYCSGVWVDIFVLDGIDPEKNITLPSIKWLAIARYLAVCDPASGSNTAIRLGKRIVCPLAACFDARRISESIDQRAKRISIPQPLYVADVIGRRGNTTEYVYKAEWFTPLRVPFEERSYCVPDGYEEVLVTRFGKDWRTPPPENERIVHTAQAYRLSP